MSFAETSSGSLGMTNYLAGLESRRTLSDVHSPAVAMKPRIVHPSQLLLVSIRYLPACHPERRGSSRPAGMIRTAEGPAVEDRDKKIEVQIPFDALPFHGRLLRAGSSTRRMSFARLILACSG